MPEEFQTRLLSQLKLALLGDCGCLKTLADLESEARLSGLTGAEIDVALRGRSFEASTAAALAYACALKVGDNGALEQARARAIRIGVTDAELRSIAQEAAQILASTKQ